MIFVTRYWHLSLKSIAAYTDYAIVRRSGDVLAAQCKCAAEGGGMQTVMMWALETRPTALLLHSFLHSAHATTKKDTQNFH